MRMKRILIVMMSVAMLSSCATYTGQGAIVGAQFGTILGSAVGGIAGGWRGSDIGAITGMAGGAVVGAAIGQAADRKAEARYEARRADYEARRADYEARRGSSDVPADDRIDIGIDGPRGERARVPESPRRGGVQVSPVQRPLVEMRNVRIIDGAQDGVLRAGEHCKVVFEVMNCTSSTLYNVCPMVVDVPHNKHLFISPNLCIESIAAGTGIRYTATIQADKRLKNGEVSIHLGVSVNNRDIPSQSYDFTLRTSKH